MARYGLPLSGYEDASVWGYDRQQATYFAQLWRNGSDSWNDPDIWISGMTPVGTPLRLAEIISARTQARLADVLRAMGAATAAPESAELLSLAGKLATSS